MKVISWRRYFLHLQCWRLTTLPNKVVLVRLSWAHLIWSSTKYLYTWFGFCQSTAFVPLWAHCLKDFINFINAEIALFTWFVISLPEWRCVWKTERGHYACVPVSPNIWIGKFAEKGRLTDQNEQIKNLFSVVNFANSHLLFLTLIYVILWNELGAHLHANYKHKITEIHQRNKHSKNGLDSIIGGFHCVRINAVKKER